jgi:eukaryotic-like serine/threonine-protein kinase
VREGDVVADKYRIERVLGTGGMGVVVQARHLHLDERVAIKFMHPHMLGDQTAVARFLQEAKAAAKIRGEHIAKVFDVATLPNGAPYIVMEFLEGGDLAAWLQKKGPLPIAQAVDFVLQACVAVAEAHMLGIVHRDLKPSNLYWVRRADGQLAIKVLDFGISKMTDYSGRSGVSATQTSAVMGSPMYMSPEQMRSARDVTLQADIWGLGVILYELISGHPPFGGQSVPEVAVKIATAAPPPLRSLRPDAPPALEAVILRCLEKTPTARFRNVGELAVALGSFGPARAGALVDRVAAMTGGVPRTEGTMAQPSVPPVSPIVPRQPNPLEQSPPIFIPEIISPMQRSESKYQGGGTFSLLLKLFGFVGLLIIGYAILQVAREIAKMLSSMQQ